ncbi:UNVERIFIED_CONTAM: hypothetical protein B566_EDAN017194 [Ephemera danica]|nr:hypothetical protein B566_EDAN017194 [Ephemera danica]
MVFYFLSYKSALFLSVLVLLLDQTKGQSVLGNPLIVPMLMAGTAPMAAVANGGDSNQMARQTMGVAGGVYDIIPPDYTIHEPPPLLDGGEPVPVEFSVSVKNIPNLDELKQELSMELNLRIYWVDKRLKVSQYFDAYPNATYMNANPALLTKIWIPDVYTDKQEGKVSNVLPPKAATFRPELATIPRVSAPRILAPPASLRIYPNTTIRYSARTTIQFACPMDFRKYPADTQSCDMSLESYAFTRDRLHFAWRPEGASENIAHRLAHFDFKFDFNGDKENVNFPSGSYPAISLTVKLFRRISYHLLQTYIPSMLFVIVSWLSFLVPPESVPGRMAICMTTLLTLTAMFAAVSLSKNLKKSESGSASPRPVTNNKTNGVEDQAPAATAEVKQTAAGAVHYKFTGDPANGPPSTNPPYCCWRPASGKNNCWTHPTKSGILMLEMISCIAVPGLFVLFNLVYWPWLMAEPGPPPPLM